jgi:hypothetical protein
MCFVRFLQKKRWLFRLKPLIHLLALQSGRRAFVGWEFSVLICNLNKNQAWSIHISLLAFRAVVPWINVTSFLLKTQPSQSHRVLPVLLSLSKSGFRLPAHKGTYLRLNLIKFQSGSNSQVSYRLLINGLSTYLQVFYVTGKNETECNEKACIELANNCVF